jgi:hypothetical protein
MHRQSSTPYWGSSLRSLAGAAALRLLVTSMGPLVFIVIWFCIASRYP